MGIWWTKSVSKWLKLPACFYDVCTILPGDCSSGVCSIPGNVTGHLSVVSDLKLCTFTFTQNCNQAYFILQGSLGFTLIQGEKGPSSALYIRSIANDGPADRDDKLRVGDRLLQVSCLESS